LQAAVFGLASIAVAGVISACGSAAGAGGSNGPAGAGGNQGAAHGSIVAAHKIAGVGTVLVDRAGRTIYSPEQEAHGKILCTGDCLSFWFPVSVAAGTTLHDPQGVTGALGTVHRAGGVTQLTYNGKPLYTFRLDSGPGQVHGNNFSDHFGSTSFTWKVIATSGSVSGASHSAKPTGGYSYPASGGYGN